MLWCSRIAWWVRIPCASITLFQKIAQFGGNARQAGGVCAVEMALWDIAGKVYNIPVYQMLGGKWRDEIRIYADTTESLDPVEYGRRAKERVAMGLTWMKMDLSASTCSTEFLTP